MSTRGSRVERWETACHQAQAACTALEEALAELKELQEEYQNWMDNLPENLQNAPVGEKLQSIVDLDLEYDSTMQNTIEEATSIELPKGFGRD